MFSGFARFAKVGLALAAAAVALGAFAQRARPHQAGLPSRDMDRPGHDLGLGRRRPDVGVLQRPRLLHLKVSKSLGASGTGTWKLDMLGSQDAPSEYGVDATIVGAATSPSRERARTSRSPERSGCRCSSGPAARRSSVP